MFVSRGRPGAVAGTACLLLSGCALHHSHQSDGRAGFESSTGQNRSDFVSLGPFRAVDSVASANFSTAFVQMELPVCQRIAPAESDKSLLGSAATFLPAADEVFPTRRFAWHNPPR
jgi:hypothetical protein